MSQLFIIEICFTKKYNTICGGGQLLVSGSPVLGVQVPGSKGWKSQVLGSQGPRVPSPRISGPQFPGYQVPGPRSQVPGSWVLGYQAPDLRVLSLGSQGPGSRVQGPDFRLCFKSQWLNFKISLVENKCLPFRTSCSQMFSKVGVLKRYVIFTGKLMRWSLFLTKFQSFQASSFIKE